MSEKAAPERADRFFLNSASGLTIDATAAVGGKSFKRRSEVPAGSRNLVAGAGADRVADIARSNPKIAIAAGAAVAAVAAAAVVRSRRNKAKPPKNGNQGKAGTPAKK